MSANLLILGDTFDQSNDDGPGHVVGGGTFQTTSTVQSFMLVSGIKVLMHGDYYDTACGDRTTMHDTLNGFVEVAGVKMLVAGDLGTSNGPHTVSASHSLGQDFVKVG